MGASVQPVPLSDADLYDSFRDRGLSHEAAVRHVERRRRANVRPEETPRGPGKGRAALAGAAQGATAGFADEIVGRMLAISDPNVPLTQAATDSSVADVRQQISEARMAHPIAAAGGNVAGAALNPLMRLLGPLTQGVGPVVKGATYGTVLGGAQGAGEADGTLRDRAIGAGVGSALGATLGGAGGLAFGKALVKGGKSLSRMWRNLRGAFQRTDRAVTQQLGKGVPPESVLQVQEAAHRAYLAKQGFPEPVIERIMESWRAGGKLPAKPPTPPPPPQTPTAMRPGETITQVSPRGFEVAGVRETPPVPTTPTIAEMLGVTTRTPDIGRGGTLPYYARGGRVEQALGSPPPAPTAPPKLAPNQNQAFIEYLKGATPEDFMGRVETIRNLAPDAIKPGMEQEMMMLLFGRVIP